MPQQVVILHGWSDSSKSFKPLAQFLKDNGFDPVPLFLGDYISLRNDVKIDDVAKRMEEVVRDRMAAAAGSPDRLAKSFDLIVHSTGGLVARRWIAMHYAERPCPVRNLLMLAPANFGSKLAHKGRSLLGRVVKGWKTGFETGDEMLYALELSSPFQWHLAQSDLLIPGGGAGSVYYAPDKIRPFVIVGTHPYTSAAAKITNENGSDGTVRVAAANMNAYGRTIDFTGGEEKLLNPDVTPWQRRGNPDTLFPLAVLPDRTHGSIIHPEDPDESTSSNPDFQNRLGRLILDALRTESPDRYAAIQTEWEGITSETRTFAGASDDAEQHRKAYFKHDTSREFFHEYYQILVRVEDEFGEPVPDYFLSFVSKRKYDLLNLNSKFSPEGIFFHDEVLESVHKHQREPANRSLFIDRYDLMRKGGFYDRIRDPERRQLHFTISAADPGDRIAYFSRKREAKRGLVLLHGQAPGDDRWLKRHSTHFLKIIIPRAADKSVFELKRA